MFVLAIRRIAYNVIWIRCQNGQQNDRCYSMLSVHTCTWVSYHSVNYSIGGVEIKNVEAEKDLGVTMGGALNSRLQCAKVLIAANKVFSVIKRTYVYKSQSNIMYLHKSLVRPHIECCCQA